MNFMFVLGNILIGLTVGALGGLAGASVLNGSAAPFALRGAMFGLLFGLLFAQRATSLGAGLMWGLSLAFLTWITVAAAAPASDNMFFGARPFSGTRVLVGLPCPAREFGARRSSQSPEPCG